ncbi:MAG TPA: TlpA disulfide reductase family protein [Pyrinomonadaceae bacterium]
MRKLATLSLSLFLLFAAACGGASGEVGRSRTPSGQSMPRTSLPMPPVDADKSAQSFTLLDNSRVTLSEYVGQVVVLDFWATYCPPCREEAPRLDALQQRFADKGLRVIGLNVGGPDDHPKIPEFARQFNLKYTLGIPDQEMINLYVGDGGKIPQTYVFDRRGRIIKHFDGYDAAASAELERTVENAVTSDE